MSTFVILALMLAPIALLLLLRSNSALVFAAICIGFTATHYISAHEVSTQLAPYIGPAKDNYIQLVLAFLAAVIVLLATIRSQQGGVRGIAINAFPALGVGFLTIALVLPFLPGMLRADIITSPIWKVALDLQAPIIGFAALASVILLVRPGLGASISFDK